MKTTRILFYAFTILSLSVWSCDSSSGPDNAAPSTPSGFQFFADSSSDGQLKMVWEANTEGDLSVYRLYRKTASTSYSLIAEPEVNEYTDKGLDYTTQYSYQLTAVDDNGNESDPTQEISAMPLNNNVPASPVLTAVTGLNDGAIAQIRLTWNPNSESDFDHYEIYRGTNVVFALDENSYLTSLASTMYLDMNTAVGTRYYYRLIAVDKGGLRSNISNQLDDLVLPLPVPVAPANAAQISSLLPEFSWNRVDNAVSYRISLKTSRYSGEIWTKDVAQSANSTVSASYTTSDPELEYNRSYYWSVITFSKSGGEANSENVPTAFVTPSN